MALTAADCVAAVTKQSFEDIAIPKLELGNEGHRGRGEVRKKSGLVSRVRPASLLLL